MELPVRFSESIEFGQPCDHPRSLRHHSIDKRQDSSPHHRHRFQLMLFQSNDKARQRRGGGLRLPPPRPFAQLSDPRRSGRTPPRVPGFLGYISRFLPLISLGWSMPPQ